MSRAYDYYIHTLLEPNDVLIRGNHKWHQPVIVQRAKVTEPKPDYRTEQEITDMEDEYLKSKQII